MKSVEDIRQFVTKKLIGNVKTELSIWNINSADEDVYPLRITLSVPSGDKFSKLANQFAAWCASMKDFAIKTDCKLEWSRRKTGFGSTVVDCPVALEVPNRTSAMLIAGSNASVAEKEMIFRKGTLEEAGFTAQNYSDFIWKTRELTELDFNLLVQAAVWIRDNDVSGMTPRELPIPDMQGKLMNSNTYRVLIANLLNKETLGLLDRPLKVELKYLNQASETGFGLCVIGTKREHDLGKPTYPCDNVIILENRDTFNSFPEKGLFSSNSVALLGNGNLASATIWQIDWLEDVENIFYWGDMDIDGLEILARCRKSGVRCKSVLMDAASFDKFDYLGTGLDKNNKPIKQKDPDELLASYMTDSERELYFALCTARGGKLRIEQEKIPYDESLEYIRRTYFLPHA